MKKILMTAIKTSISEVMETMFFLPVEFGRESVLDQCGMEKENTVTCQLAFEGDISGYLILFAPKTLIEQMAEDFMGEPRENLTDEHLTGTLTEMLNMICGNALSKIDSKVPFELGIAKMIDKTETLGKEVFTIVETTESKMAIFLKTD